MSETSPYPLPPELGYSRDHEWLAQSGDTATVGITAFAAESLGDIVYVELPAQGTTVEAGAVCGEIESTKSVSELYAPADGRVIAVNDAVVADPSLVNTDPYGAGWLYRLTVGAPPSLLSAQEYQAFVEGVSGDAA